MAELDNKYLKQLKKYSIEQAALTLSSTIALVVRLP